MEEARSTVHLTGLPCPSFPLLGLVSMETLRATFSLSLDRLNLLIFPSHADHGQCWRCGTFPEGVCLSHATGS